MVNQFKNGDMLEISKSLLEEALGKGYQIMVLQIRSKDPNQNMWVFKKVQEEQLEKYIVKLDAAQATYHYIFEAIEDFHYHPISGKVSLPWQ
ncbi:hypothetical protein [Sphingobacterium sp.]|uniref:hypothetical protein n=1 Tax=Sphingobacterium sp. TaxID=341027 RepID=UPI0028AA2D2F|nr:hypothetical protein [Sphingobacterium sp.]